MIGYVVGGGVTGEESNSRRAGTFLISDVGGGSSEFFNTSLRDRCIRHVVQSCAHLVLQTSVVIQ